MRIVENFQIQLRVGPFEQGLRDHSPIASLAGADLYGGASVPETSAGATEESTMLVTASITLSQQAKGPAAQGA